MIRKISKIQALCESGIYIPKTSGYVTTQVAIRSFIIFDNHCIYANHVHAVKALEMEYYEEIFA